MSAHLTIDDAVPLSRQLCNSTPSQEFWRLSAREDTWLLVDHAAVYAIPPTFKARRAALAASNRSDVTLYIGFGGVLYSVDFPLEGVTL